MVSDRTHSVLYLPPECARPGEACLETWQCPFSRTSERNWVLLKKVVPGGHATKL